MTGTLSLPLEQTDPVGAALFLFLIAAAIAAYFLFRRATALTVPPDSIGIIRAHHYRLHMDKVKRILRAGDKYHPYKQAPDDHVQIHSLLPQTHLVGRYAVTWRITDIDRYARCMWLNPRIDSVPIPILNFQELLKVNPAIDFTAYAEEYGIEVIKVEPPIGQLRTPEVVTIGYRVPAGDAATLTYEDRTQHVYLTGRTKSGKSTLLVNMAIADIRAGKGMAFLDPHGDAAKKLLSLIPRGRANDVFYIDGDHPLPLSIMDWRNDAEREILSDDIYTLLRGMSDTWGERMDAILTNTLAALFSARNCSFLDIYHFLAGEDFRQAVLSRVDNQAILRFWANYKPPNYPKGSEQPILSRLERFITRPTLAAILGSPSGIDLYDVMQSGKILLVNTSRETMGEHTGRVLGGLIVTKLYQTAMRRARIPEGQRRPFYLYIDEFPTYIAAPLESILSQTRKYGLSLTLAHQYPSQASEITRKAISNDVGTAICFQLGYDDAKHLGKQFGRFDTDHIMNLSSQTHEALVRPIQGPAYTFQITTPPPPMLGENLSSEILANQPKHDRQALHDTTEPDDEVRPGVLPPK